MDAVQPKFNPVAIGISQGIALGAKFAAVYTAVVMVLYLLLALVGAGDMGTGVQIVALGSVYVLIFGGLIGLAVGILPAIILGGLTGALMGGVFLILKPYSSLSACRTTGRLVSLGIIVGLHVLFGAQIVASGGLVLPPSFTQPIPAYLIFGGLPSLLFIVAGGLAGETFFRKRLETFASR